MQPEAAPTSDADLSNKIIHGLVAAQELENRFRQKLERHLISECDRSDGRSHERSVEIVSEVLTECYIKKPSLLERWDGPDNLEAFLTAVAKNRLKSWWSSAYKKRTDVDTDSNVFVNTPSRQATYHTDELRIAEQAIINGVRAAMKECPEGLVFMRLKGLHGVDQRVIASCWGLHESQTSRRIKDAMAIIRTRAIDAAAGLNCELSIDLLQQSLQQNPDILLGRVEPIPTRIEHSVLNLLASGKADPKDREEAVKIMASHPETLAFFAQILNRRNKHDALIFGDSALSGMAGRLSDSTRRSLDIMLPSEAVGLVTPTMIALFGDLLKQIRADGGTLWLLCPGSACLEAVVNPFEPEIVGKRQPLVSGIISLVLATGEAACVPQVIEHNRHSPGIDIALGKTTHSMIASPFHLGGANRGVLTAVRFNENDVFGESDTAVIGRCAEVLSNLMIQNLAEAIMK